MTMHRLAISRSVWGLLIIVGLTTNPCQAGSLSWLDEVVQQVMREASVGARSATRAEGQAGRMAGKLFVRESEESLATLATRSDAVARLATKLDEPTEAALRLRFGKLVGQDPEMVRAFAQLAPQERRLVLGMSEAAQKIASRYPGQADTMVRKLGVEGLSAVRAYGDDVAEVLAKEGPDSVEVLRKAGRTGWTFFTEQVLPHKGKLAAAGVFALFLAAPEQFVDSAGRATQYAAEQFASAGVMLAGAVATGAAHGLDQAAAGLMGPYNHPLLRGLLAMVAAAAFLVVIGFPLRVLLQPGRWLLAWPLRIFQTLRPSHGQRRTV